jgi:hypothetical protein
MYNIYIYICVYIYGVNLNFAHRIMPSLTVYHKGCLSTWAAVSIAATTFHVFSGLGFASSSSFGNILIPPTLYEVCLLSV